MATFKQMFSKPITPSPEFEYDFSKDVQRAENTGIILNSALHFECHLIGIGERDSRFPSATVNAPIANFIFAEGKVDNWEVSWLIANHSKQGNKFGFTGCSPLLHFDFIKGIYVYDGTDWQKSPPL